MDTGMEETPAVWLRNPNAHATVQAGAPPPMVSATSQASPPATANSCTQAPPTATLATQVDPAPSEPPPPPPPPGGGEGGGR
mmetsp:Transcript_41016/g.100024  ORF Transcript_41016/g.100024 Transcript_41016/m.100024 type:complete len:82 (-) Transcript_41016:9-254(-)